MGLRTNPLNLIRIMPAKGERSLSKSAPVEGAFFMNLIVNGQSTTADDAVTLDNLIRAEGANPERVAVLVNQSVIPKNRREEIRLRENDRIEILSFAGGG